MYGNNAPPSGLVKCTTEREKLMDANARLEALNVKIQSLNDRAYARPSQVQASPEKLSGPRGIPEEINRLNVLIDFLSIEIETISQLA